MSASRVVSPPRGELRTITTTDTAYPGRQSADAPPAPAVSVLLATHGRPTTLGRALDSMAAQTLARDRFEVVVIINGPIGASAEVVDDFSRRHPHLRVRVLESLKPGVAHARTLGLWAAHGEYVTILDDDDWVSPAFLDQLLQHAAPGVIPLAWMADIYDDAPDVPRFDNYYASALERFRGDTVPALRLRQAISLNVCKLVPTAAARESGYDERLRGGSDFVFWAKLSPTTSSGSR